MQFDIADDATRLLDWLCTQARWRADTVVDARPFTAEHLDGDRSVALRVVDLLVGRGSIRRTGADESGLTVSSDGMASMRFCIANRSNPTTRTEFVRRMMVRWLHQRDDAGRTARGWPDYQASNMARLLGDRFTLAEVLTQADHLSEMGLLDTDERGSPRLTDRGRECAVDYAGFVSQYLDRQEGPEQLRP